MQSALKIFGIALHLNGSMVTFGQPALTYVAIVSIIVSMHCTEYHLTRGSGKLCTLYASVLLVILIHGRTWPPGCLALARWAGSSAV